MQLLSWRRKSGLASDVFLLFVCFVPRRDLQLDLNGPWEDFGCRRCDIVWARARERTFCLIPPILMGFREKSEPGEGKRVLKSPRIAGNFRCALVISTRMPPTAELSLIETYGDRGCSKTIEIDRETIEQLLDSSSRGAFRCFRGLLDSFQQAINSRFESIVLK